MPIPPDSDPRKRRAMNAATALASSGSSQMQENGAVAETPTRQNLTTDVSHESRMDVEEEERDESRSSTAQKKPDDELRRKHRWRRTKVTRQRWQ